LIFYIPPKVKESISAKQITSFFGIAALVIIAGAMLYFLPKLCITLAFIAFFYLLTFALLKAASRN
jgi:hypothetical protein